MSSGGAASVADEELPEHVKGPCGDDRFADSANQLRVAPHIRQEPARRFGPRLRRDVVPAADPLDGGRRPRPGRVAGAPTGGRDRPFQGRRDLPQRPAENPAAPDQHHHLVIVLTDQFPDPLTGRDAAGPGVDFPTSQHAARHDTTPAEPGSAGRAVLQLVLPPIGCDRGETSLLQGLLDVQNRSFHLVDQLRGRPRPLYQVRDRRFLVRSNDVCLHKPHETTNAIRTQGRAFSFSRAPECRIRKNPTFRMRTS